MEEYSKTGNKNLENLDSATHFTEWMYAQVSPYLKGSILEIGSGTGTYSKKIIRDFSENIIILSEIDPHYLETLKQNFEARNIIIKKINLEEKDASRDLPPVDCAFALNVFEHIEHDERALQNVYDFLTPGGTFVILVPAHQWLYNRIDASIGHFRRYSKKTLQEKAVRAGFSVKKIYYFNFFSIFGWYLNGSILKKQEISSSLLTMFDRFVPALRFFEEKLLRGRIGISVIAVLEKSI